MAGIVVVLPPLDRLRGLSIDVLTALHWHAFGQAHDPAASPVVVVALDEETYLTPPFAGTPSIAWTGEIGRVLTAVIAGGAKVVGFDLVFPISLEQSELPVGDETLGTRLQGIDRAFLRALQAAARENKIVLGEVQHREQPIVPSPTQRIVVNGQRNIRALNVFNDSDDVVRRVPLSFAAGDTRPPSMAVELAARALGQAPQFGETRTSLAGYQVPGLVPNTMTLNFAGGAGDVPTYSFADLAACAAANNPEFFRRAFSDKIVLFGTLLDVEDRKVTSKRFATAPENARGARCVYPAKPQAPGPVSNTISGVYVHATAVSNLIRQDALTELNGVSAALVSALFAFVVAGATLAFAPAAATFVYAGAALGLAAIATAVFDRAYVLPVVETTAAGLIALIAATAYRVVIADKDKRFLRRSFALYLAPSLIDKMVAANRQPVLGGETRTITSFFSDIAGFSTLSETLTPGEIVALMNEYLSAMTDIIEAHGGFVDKYVGDAIAAVFGAPLDDPAHATNAVRAALACGRRLAELERTGDKLRSRKLAHRIGLNTGAALIGNIGSRRRFNYTAMGDMVNLASRLEGANKYFGTSIMAAEATVAATGNAFVWRELDLIRVQGRAQPVRIFEPLAAAGEGSPEQLAQAAAYADGLARWQARDFAGAAEYFVRFAHIDPPAALFLARAKALAAHPPGPEWEPVYRLEGK
ncbi:MAG: adenylate/guanylate cyclase domain-containing protein [Xanthobacteraceae bacterium]|nr:adenylate/guanylate cyclase domain-containing protein [Xanthobacteraceae bacterium]